MFNVWSLLKCSEKALNFMPLTENLPHLRTFRKLFLPNKRHWTSQTALMGAQLETPSEVPNFFIFFYNAMMNNVSHFFWPDIKLHLYKLTALTLLFNYLKFHNNTIMTFYRYSKIIFTHHTSLIINFTSSKYLFMTFISC